MHLYHYFYRVGDTLQVLHEEQIQAIALDAFILQDRIGVRVALGKLLIGIVDLDNSLCNAPIDIDQD
jgi:hypothetical protein